MKSQVNSIFINNYGRNYKKCMVAENAERINTLHFISQNPAPQAESSLFTTTVSWRVSKCSTHP